MSTANGFVTLELESDLPSLPAAALEVLRLCQEPAELDDLARVLSHDPMLASRVLRMANSAACRRRSEVTSLQAACVMLGMRALRIVALGFTITEALPRRGVWAGLNSRRVLASQPRERGRRALARAGGEEPARRGVVPLWA